MALRGLKGSAGPTSSPPLVWENLRGGEGCQARGAVTGTRLAARVLGLPPALAAREAPQSSPRPADILLAVWFLLCHPHVVPVTLMSLRSAGQSSPLSPSIPEVRV